MPLFGPDTYILRTPPGWLGGMFVLMTKPRNKSPYGGFYSWFSYYAGNAVSDVKENSPTEIEMQRQIITFQ